MESLMKAYVRIRESKGQGMAEYALILALIAVVSILALTGLGTAIAAQLTAVTTAL
jgi:pilus assembly protein Flp/PilA